MHRGMRYCKTDKSDSLLCWTVCLLVVMICSQMQREMDASLKAKYVCMCALHVKHTADLCHHCGSLQGTKGRLKNQECLCSSLHSI